MKRWICFLGLVGLTGVAVAKPVSVLELNTKVSNWLGYYSDSAGTNAAYDALTTLGVSNVSFAVWVDDGTIAAVAKIETTLPDARSVWLSNTNLMRLEAVSGNDFKWLPDERKKTSPQLAPLDSMRVRFSGNTVLVADAKQFSSAEALESNMGASSLLEGSIQLVPLLEPLFDAAEKIVAEQEEGFGKAMMAGILESLKASAQSVLDMPGVSVAVEAGDPQTRKMSLTLEYQTADAAGSTKAFFNDSSDAWKNPKISKQQMGLAGLVDTPHFREINLKGSNLQFIYEWPASADAALLELVGKATVGNLFSFGNTASFPVHPEETMDAPSLGNRDGFDAAELRKKRVRSALFFNHSWASHVDLTVDYLDIPNVDLLTATLTNVSVLATNGVDITEQKRPGSFRYDSAKGSASISLRREKDGPPAKTASFTLELTVPTSIEKHTISKQNPVFETEEGGCCLIALSNSVVALRSKELSLRDAKIYALNKDGKYLKRDNASWSDSSFRAEYKGTPEIVELVWPVKTESVSLDFKDLAVGKEDKLKMPSDPTNNIPTRYTSESVKTYSDPDMEAIAASSMTYITNAGWKKNEHQLQFPKPVGVEVDRMYMRSYLAGVDEIVSKGAKTSASSGNHFYWDLKQTNLLNSATAIFGEIAGEFWSGIGIYTINVSTNPFPLIPDRELPSAWIEHNVVWIESEKKGNVLDVQAFNETGRRLKKDNRTGWSNTKKGYYFWGVPSRVTVAYASSKANIVVPFEIELKDGGLAGIPAAREKVAEFNEVLDLVKEIDKKANHSFGALLSGNYYFCNSKKEPCAAIPLEVAHSDPDGASIFGYELKPHKGYYFRKILTGSEIERNRKPSSYLWAGGSFESGSDRGRLMATPVDSKAPAILISWNDVYVNYKDCSKLESISTSQRDLETVGWIRIE